MTKQVINVGTSENSNDGDRLRDAFIKVNANFTELYNNGGSGTIDLSAVNQHIIPAIDNTYDLGSTTHAWRSLYVSTNTIYINNVPLSLDGSGNLTVNNEPVANQIDYTLIPNAPTDIADLTDNTGLLVGATGPKGDKGDKGDTGATGPTGPQGATGATGATGPRGEQGLTGPQGLKGDTGAAGATGPKGDKGDPGNTGATGAKGDTGAQGPAGNDGATGPTGATGPQGATGATGPKGDKGDQGIPGNDSTVAGPKGDTGAQGVSVTLQGTKATIGDLPAAPVDWNDFAGHGWIVTTGDGSSHVDGALWFWNLNTGEWNDIGPIVGPQGDPGPKGDQGDKGDQGEPGNDGQTGPTGATGPTGPTGATGPKGDKGDQGVPGADGQDGAAGANGADGLDGTSFIWQSTWNGGSYVPNDVVEYQGSSYICTVGNTDTLPTDTDYWALMTAKGEQGPQGPGADQDLNTDSSVEFNDISVTGTIPRIAMAANSYAPPTINETSDGAKLVLFPQSSNEGYGDYAIGIEAGALWTQIPDSGSNVKWYAGDTEILKLDGYGNLTLGNDILARPSNDLNLQVFDPGVEGAGVTISLQNRNADSGSKTTQFSVNPDSVSLITNFTNGQYEWLFDNSGILNLPASVDENALIQSTYSIELKAGTHSLLLDTSGNLTLDGNPVGGGGGNPFDQSLNMADNVTFAKVSITGVENSVPAMDFFDGAEGNHIVALNTDWTLKLKARAQGGNEGHLYLEAGGSGTRVQINGSGSTVQIVADNGDNSGSWQFDNNGILTLPYSNYLETTDINLAVGSQGAVFIRSNAADNVNDKTWTFGTDGTLTVPGTINAHDLIKGRNKTGDYYSWNITGLAMLDIEYGFTQGSLTIDGLWPLAGKVQVVISGIAVPAEANGIWYAQSRTGNTVYLFSDENTPLDISAWSGYTGGGTLEVKPLTYDLNISAGLSYPNSDNGHVNITTDDGNDTYTWKFDNKGNLILAGSVVASGGRYYQDCSDSWTSFRWVNSNTDGEPIELGRVYADGGTPYTGDESESNERTQFGYQEIDEGVSSFYIIATQNTLGIGTDEGDDRKWVFRGDGDLELPGGLKKEDQTLTFTTIDPLGGLTGLQVGISEPYTNTLLFGSNEKGLMVQGGGAVILQSGLNTESPVIIAGAWGNTEGANGGDVLIYGGYSYDGTEGNVLVSGNEVVVGAFNNIDLWAGEWAEWHLYGEDGSMQFPDGTLQYTAYQGTTIVSDTAPTDELGRLWFNSRDGRMYVKYNDLWVDASPVVVPAPETYLEGLTIEGTVISAVDRDTPVGVDGGLTITGQTTLAGNLVPDTSPRSLGTAERRFAELHVDVIDGGEAATWLEPV